MFDERSESVVIKYTPVLVVISGDDNEKSLGKEVSHFA